MKFVCLLLAAVLLLALSGYAVAMSYMSRDRVISPPPPPNRFMSFLDKHGFAPSWECTRMADRLPPLPPEFPGSAQKIGAFPARSRESADQALRFFRFQSSDLMLPES